MKTLLFRKLATGVLPLASCALLMGAATAYSQTTNVYVDPSYTWVGYMNVFDLPANGGAYEFGQSWGTGALPALFNGTQLTLSPNVNNYNASDSYWVNTDGSGNKSCDASFYVQDNTLAGQTVTFSGYCLTNTLVSPYTCTVFIKDFDSGYNLVGSSTATPPEWWSCYRAKAPQRYGRSRRGRF